jgi:hypothetical protein
MKKIAAKKPLRLTTQTVRTLTSVQLDAVAGGLLSASCNIAMSCATKACNTATKDCA